MGGVALHTGVFRTALDHGSGTSYTLQRLNQMLLLPLFVLATQTKVRTDTF